MEKLRNARANSKRSFSRINRSLLRHITDKAEPSLVQDCWGELQTAWSDVEQKHNDYVSLLSSEQEMEKEDTWMDEMYDIFSTTKKAFFSFNNEIMKNVKEETGTDVQNIKQPEILKLRMPLFSGTQDDVMSFNDFLKMFDDLIGNNSAYNQSAKLMYLKSYLRGNALDTIKHLSTEEKNYTIARKFLTEEYLDTDIIVEEHIRKLHDLTPPPARDLPALRAFFNTARTSVYELKAFGYDALEDGTLGSKIVSFIICEKLPVNFKVKLSAILHTDYPSTRQLLENFNAVIKSLMKTTPAKQETKHTKDLSSKPKQLKTTEVAGSAKPTKSSLQRFQTSAEPIKKTLSHSTSKFKACKLCEGAHSMLKCSAYTSPRTRIQRLKDLELCTRCSGSHKLTDCKGQTSGLSYPCTLCGSKQHISAVCVVKPGETTPLQSGMRLICNSLQKGQTVLLPSMTVIMHNGERSELVRCMIDVGSQASYISEELAVKLGCPLEAPKTTYKVKTCIGVQEKSYRTATSDIIFTPTASAHHCFLVDPEMSLEYEIPGVTSLVQFLRAQGVRLADSFFSHSTNDVIGDFECLLGADIIGAIKPMRSVDLGTGTAFEVQDGLILFGSVDGYFEQLNLKENTEHDEGTDEAHGGGGPSDSNEQEDDGGDSSWSDDNGSGGRSSPLPGNVNTNNSNINSVKRSTHDSGNRSQQGDPCMLQGTDIKRPVNMKPKLTDKETQADATNEQHTQTLSSDTAESQTQTDTHSTVEQQPQVLRQGAVEQQTQTQTNKTTNSRQRLTNSTADLPVPDRSTRGKQEGETSTHLLVQATLHPKTSYFHPLAHVSSDSDVDLQLEHLFSIESLGIRETDESVSARERRLVEEFSNEVELKDGKYFIKVPFYDSVTKVPENHDVALATMKKVRSKLVKRGLADSYTAVFEQQLRDGIIEEVDHNKPSTNQRVFIPHHPVVKTDAQTTTKIRPVFNCSLKIGDRPSLNEACFRGVDLLNDLVTLLMKFRTNKHILLADIEKAFLQIYLKYEEDKDKFCFLWETDDGLKMYRFRTILFGLNCSPFILSHIIQIHLSKYSTTMAATALKGSLYVDNFIFSTSDEGKLLDIYRDATQIMKEGGFNLRSWMSNFSPLVDIMMSDNMVNEHGAVTEKVLGYLYDAKQDTISLSDFNFEENQQGITKRQLLSNISKVFDPLSLALPVTIRGRILMKQVWTEGTAWDEDVSPAVLAEWQRLKKDLLSLREFQFSRETGDTESSQPTDLHLFCDGSKTSYGFACYLKQEGSDPQLVFAKSKLAPDNRSIPQMELLAVFLALKCLPLIIDSINASIRHVRLWSDAQVVLEWLASGCKSKSKFTANRLEDITAMKLKIHHQHQVEVTHHYVSTDSNVADMLTRGLSAKEFHKKLAFWCHGPDWLGDHPEQWPKSPLHCLSEEGKVMVELQQHHQQVEINTEAQTPATQTILSIKDFSSLRRLHGVTARVFHFVNVLKHREADAKEQATHYWLKVMQENAFTEEISYLQDKQENKLVNSASVPKLVKELNVFIDKSGLLRCRGRLSKLNRYSYAVHNPILLDKTHRLTTLMIEDQHRRCKHLGVGTTLTELREHGYWIPSGRQVVKRVLKDCITCQKLNALAFEYPKMTNLPRERVSLIKPFCNTAIDYTGHILVEDTNGEMRKMYIVLYTCLAIRCVHLDLVPDLSLGSFLQSFRRFCSTYGVPEFLYTDNAKQFLASQRVLIKIFTSDEFQEYLTEQSIKHSTIPVYASWVGGVYERQIKTVKHCLYKTVGRAKLGYFELLTQLSEIQNMVNSRPITYVYSEIDDIEPLTPNKILKLHTNPRLQLVDSSLATDPLWVSTPQDVHQQLNKTLHEQQHLQEHYKNMWYREYLLGLRENSRDLFHTDWDDKIAVGDVVLINTKNKPRVFWLMGRVLQLLHGDDGRVRQVLLKTSTGRTERYAISHLYPLELQSTHTGQDSTDGSTRCPDEPTTHNTETESSPEAPERAARLPRRRAAIKQTEMVKSLLQSGSI